MPTLTEGKPRSEDGSGEIHFDFPTGWHVVKYDAEGGFYRSIITRYVQGVRGVDFVASPVDASRLFFIEVKDCRKDVRPEDSLNNALLETVQRKTLNTLAGLLTAERLQVPELRALSTLSRQPLVEVILFLVEPEPITPAIATLTGHKLRRATRVTGRTDLAQKLTAILASWGLSFKLLGSPAPLQLPSAANEGWTVRIE